MFPWLWLVHHCWWEKLDLISYMLTNLQKKLLGSAEMATFSLVVLSLFLIRSKELGTQWTDMYLVDDCMECQAGNVILKWLCYSPVCSDDGNGLQCGDDDWSSWMRVVFQILPAKLNSKFLHHVTVGPPCVPRSPWMLTPCDQGSGWPYDGPYCPFYRKPLMHNDLSLKPQSQLQ